MPMRPVVAKLMTLVCVAALASGCSLQSDSDDLARARRNLHIAPCGPDPAVAGVAGVNKDPRQVYLGDWIVVTVCHLDRLMETSEAQQQPITLFIEGHDFGVQPTGIDRENGALIFALDRDEGNKSLWKPFLYNPLFDPTVPVRVSVGVHGSHPLPRARGANLRIDFYKVYTDWLEWAWLAFLAAIVIALVLYARRSDLLRDGPSVAGIRRPFSLARAQMAWWFFLILIGYNLIWLVTGDRDTIPPSLLTLLGISAATALAAVAITSRGDSGGRRRLLDGEIASLDDALQGIAVDIDEAARRAADPAAATSATAAALRSALEKKRAELEALRATLVTERAGVTAIVPSKGFWSDLVTDDRGAISLDRFQIVAWSLVLGGVFLGSVVWELTMPEFNATLLALMGISSGTYIGFKLPSSKSGG